MQSVIFSNWWSVESSVPTTLPHTTHWRYKDAAAAHLSEPLPENLEGSVDLAEELLHSRRVHSGINIDDYITDSDKQTGIMDLDAYARVYIADKIMVFTWHRKQQHGLRWRRLILILMLTVIVVSAYIHSDLLYACSGFSLEHILIHTDDNLGLAE